MKRVLLFTLFILSFKLAAQSWTAVAPMPVWEYVIQARMLDENSGWLTTFSGTILKTSDGFNSFERVKIPFYYMIEFTALNTQEAYAIVAPRDNNTQRLLVKTLDGGHTWNLVSLPAGNNSIRAYYFLDINNGWFIGTSSMYRTTDGGSTWIFSPLPGPVMYYTDCIFFTSPSTGWASTGKVLFKTSNGGISWDTTAVFSNTISSIKFMDSQKGFIVVVNPYSHITLFLKTNDGGNTWIQASSINSGDTNIEMFVSGPRIVLSYWSRSYISDDEGSTWRNLLFGYRCTLVQDLLYAVTGTGVIKKSTDFGYTWIDKGSTVSGGEKKIIFTSDGTGFTAPHYRSTDGGNTWFNRSVNLPPQIYDWSFLSSTHGYCTAHEKLYETTDGGTTYHPILSFQPEDGVDHLDFINDSVGWFNYGWYFPGPQWWGISLYKTTDRGITWNHKFDPGWYSLYFFKFANDSMGFLRVGDPNNPEQNTSFKTTNGGETWQQSWFGQCSAVFFFDNAKGVAVIHDTLYKTYNKGDTYFPAGIIPNTSYDYYPAGGLYFADTLNGWAGSSNGVYRTTDGGFTWTLEMQGLFSINELKKYGNNLFALQEGGAIFKRNLDDVTPVEMTSFTGVIKEGTVELKWATATEINNKGFYVEKRDKDSYSTLTFIPGKGSTTEKQEYRFSEAIEPGSYTYRLKQVDYNGSFKYSKEVSVEYNIPKEFSLEQNYPNPFNPTTMIKFSIPENGNVKLKVYDVLGREIQTLVNEQKAAGEYEVSFGNSSLSSGIYIYKLTAGNLSQSKTMVMVK